MTMPGKQALSLAAILSLLIASCDKPQSPVSASPSPSPASAAAFIPAGSSEAAGIGSVALFEGLPEFQRGTEGFRKASMVPGGICLLGERALLFIDGSGQETKVDLEQSALEILGIAENAGTWRIFILDAQGILAIDPRQPSILSRLGMPGGDSTPPFLAAMGREWTALAGAEGGIALFSNADLSPGPALEGGVPFIDMAWSGDELALLGAEGRLYFIDPRGEDGTIARIRDSGIAGQFQSLVGGEAGFLASGPGGASLFILPGGRGTLDFGILSTRQEVRAEDDGFIARLPDGSLVLASPETVEGILVPGFDSTAFGPDPLLPLSARRAGDSWLVSGDLDISLRSAAGESLANRSLSDPPIDAPILSGGTLWYLGSRGLWRLGGAARETEFLISDEILDAIRGDLGRMKSSGIPEADDIDIQPWSEGLLLPFSRTWRLVAYDSPDGSSAKVGVSGNDEFVIAAFDSGGNIMMNNRNYELETFLSLSLGAGKTYYFAYSPIEAGMGKPVCLEISRGM